MTDKKKEKKDIWDIVSSISTVISGIIIALVGIYATHTFNNQKLETENRQVLKEIELKRIGIIKSYFKELTSNDKRLQQSSLFLISSLDPYLALNIGQNLVGNGCVKLATQLLKSQNQKVATRAIEVITQVLFDSNYCETEAKKIILNHFSQFDDIQGIIKYSINKESIKQCGIIFQKNKKFITLFRNKNIKTAKCIKIVASKNSLTIEGPDSYTTDSSLGDFNQISIIDVGFDARKEKIEKIIKIRESCLNYGEYIYVFYYDKGKKQIAIGQIQDQPRNNCIHVNFKKSSNNKYPIKGSAVFDSSGNLVGLLSTYDFMREPIMQERRTISDNYSKEIVLIIKKQDFSRILGET